MPVSNAVINGLHPPKLSPLPVFCFPRSCAVRQLSRSRYQFTVCTIDAATSLMLLLWECSSLACRKLAAMEGSVTPSQLGIGPTLIGVTLRLNFALQPIGDISQKDRTGLFGDFGQALTLSRSFDEMINRNSRLKAVLLRDFHHSSMTVALWPTRSVLIYENL